MLNSSIKPVVVGLGLAVVLFLFISLAVYSDIKDQQEWLQFSETHHCRETGKVGESTSYGFLSNGKAGFLVTPARTTYTCDNNYTVTRDDQ